MAAKDADFLKPFIEGTLETLKVQCSRSFKVGTPIRIAKGEKRPEQYTCDIAGVIGLTSNVFQGSIALAFKDPAFLYVMSGMLGEDYTEVDDDLVDGVGELLNIIFGYGKRIITDKGYKVEMAIPTVVRGSNIILKQVTNADTVVIPFESPEQSFHIEITLGLLPDQLKGE
jgi:chemotaxis protein CheX